ncbi:MAG: vWA domain-containing protein, partial [Polyangiaceae bacterium]
DPNISYAGPYSVPDVPVRIVNSAQKSALHARLDTTAPYLGTPTYEVLSGAYAALEGFVPGGGLAANGKRVVVLITDGVPDPDMPAGRSMANGEVTGSLSITTAEAAKKPPVTTFAVGVGQLDPIDISIYDPQFMGAIAVAGGSPNMPCDPNETVNPANMCHFQITPGTKTAAMLAQEFIAAINTIRTKLLTCEYVLEKPDGGAEVDPAKVNVVFTNGGGMKSVVPPDATNGWSYDDPKNPTKVILNGASCAAAKADASGKITVVLGCKTIIK